MFMDTHLWRTKLLKPALWMTVTYGSKHFDIMQYMYTNLCYISWQMLLWRVLNHFILMLGFHRSRLSYDLEILYDRGVDFPFILNGRLVLGCPWLNLTGRGQYQKRLIFSTASKIHLVGELILHLIAGCPRSPYIWSFIACYQVLDGLQWP